MRLRILSDLHLDSGLPDLPEIEADVVVLAGDTAEGTRGVEWAREQFPETPVVYVPGNHEYYGHSFPDLVHELRRAAEGSLVHVLEQETLTLGGVEFLGCTLWTDQNLWEQPEFCAKLLERTLNDYHRIRSGVTGKLLRASETREAHFRARRWLEEACASPPKGPRVIVTHHAPSPRSIPLEEWRAAKDLHHPSNAGLNLLIRSGYASQMDDQVGRSGACLWVHGHIHEPVNYPLGKSQVLSNPRGYDWKQQTHFRPDSVFEILVLGCPPPLAQY